MSLNRNSPFMSNGIWVLVLTRFFFAFYPFLMQNFSAQIHHFVCLRNLRFCNVWHMKFTILIYVTTLECCAIISLYWSWSDQLWMTLCDLARKEMCVESVWQQKKNHSIALWLSAVAMVVKYNCRSFFSWNCDSMWFS